MIFFLSCASFSILTNKACIRNEVITRFLLGTTVESKSTMCYADIDDSEKDVNVLIIYNGFVMSALLIASSRH